MPEPCKVVLESTDSLSQYSQRNDDIVAANLHSDQSSTAGFKPGPGVTREFLSVEHQSRIGITGDIVGCNFPVETDHGHPGLTSVTINIWRGPTNNATLIGSSNNIKADIASAPPNSIVEVMFAAPIQGVREGDYFSVCLEATEAMERVVRRTGSVQSPGTKFVDDRTQDIGYNWDVRSSVDAFIPLELLIQAPNIVGFGHSLMAGHGQHFSFIETQANVDLQTQIPHKIVAAFPAENWNYRNMGIGGNNSNVLLARFQQDVLDLHPRICLFLSGTTDIFQSVSTEQFLANLTTMFDQCNANDIKVIAYKIPPDSRQTDAQADKRRTINAAMDAFVTSHNAMIIDVDDTMGVIRPSTGELDDLNPLYDDGSGVHFNDAGHTAMAILVINALNQLSTSQITVIDLPKITTAQLNGLQPDSENRYMVYNTTTNRLTIWNGVMWEEYSNNE